MQSIPTNLHFCHQCEAILSGRFGIPGLFRGYPAIHAGLAFGELF